MSRCLRTLLTLLLLGLPVLAWAALGENASSIDADQAQLKASRRISSAALYTVHEIQTPNGTAVREYVNASGTVFAVAWKGPFIPDLQQLLGSYFDQYTSAVSSKRSGHGPVRLNQPGLVVHSAGHMRAFAGRAYVPQLLPQGVTIEELK